MRVLQDKAEMLWRNPDPKNMSSEIYSKVYKCNLTLKRGQKFGNTLIIQKEIRSAHQIEEYAQKIFCYYYAFIELEN